MRKLWREHGLLLVSGFLFLVIWVAGQTTTGYRVFNEEQKAHGEETVAFGKYLRSAHFGEATAENWESEFLQMGAYVVLTIRLRQKGSAESKGFEPEEVDEDPENHRKDLGAPGPVKRGGLALKLYSNSLSIAFFVLFGLSFLLHAIAGAHNYSDEQESHGEPRVGAVQYVQRSQFWFESLQNWQSEFLAVAAIVGLSVFLRQHGSPESKPVHAPHSQTGA